MITNYNNPYVHIRQLSKSTESEIKFKINMMLRKQKLLNIKNCNEN